MSLLLDGLVLLIIGLCIFIGWKRGAAITLLNFAAFVAAVTVAVLLSPALSKMIYETFFKSGVTEKIAASIGNSLGDGMEAVINSVISVVPAFAAVFVDSASLNQETISAAVESGNQDTINSAAGSVEALIAPAFTSLIGIILIILLFFVLYSIFRFLAKYLSKFFEVPVLSIINRVFGGVIGIGKGVLVAILIVAVIRLALPLMGADVPVLTQENIDNSIIFKSFYTGDIIDNIVSMFI